MNPKLKRIYDMKEGALFGLIIGFLVGKFLLPHIFDLNSVASAQSMLDFVKTASTTTLDFAKNKIVIATSIIGLLAGAIIDDMLPERWWRKR